MNQLLSVLIFVCGCLGFIYALSHIVALMDFDAWRHDLDYLRARRAGKKWWQV